MGLQTKPAYIGTSGFQNPVENDRNLTEYKFRRQGVIGKGSFDAAPVTNQMQLAVQGGGAVLLGSASTQGGYFGYSDAAENLAWPASNPSNPRIDSLLMRVIDTQYGADAAGDLLRWEIVQGTAAASPVELTDTQINTSFPHPGAWMRMWNVRVPSAATNLNTATVTRRFPYTNSLGSLLYASAVETRPTGTYYGERLIDITTNLRYWWDGTQWRYDPGQLLYNKVQNNNGYLVQAQSGFQTAFTSPSIAVEPGQSLWINVRLPFICVPTANVDIDGIVSVAENGGSQVDVHKFGVSRMSLANNYYPLQTRFPYKTGASATSAIVKLTSWASVLYDVRCDPLYVFSLAVETTGKLSSEWV
jgi:hypothetical protein